MTKKVELMHTINRLGKEYRTRHGHSWRYDGCEVLYVRGYFQLRKNGETLATSAHADVLHNHLVDYVRSGTPNMAMLRAGVRRITTVQTLLRDVSETSIAVAPELETPRRESHTNRHGETFDREGDTSTEKGTGLR